VKRRSLLGVYGSARNPLIDGTGFIPIRIGLDQWIAVGILRAVRVKLQVPPLRYLGFPVQEIRVRSPGFPVELGGVGELHAAFRNESSTRGCVRRRVAGNPGPVGMTKLRAVAHLGTSGGGWTESKKLI
jgi:hypothetical protein